MMDRRVDLAVSAAVAVLGVVLLVAAGYIRLGAIADPVGPRGFPRYLGALFIVCGTALAARRIAKWEDADGDLVPSDGKEDDEPSRPGSALRAMGVALVAAMYALVMPILGYLPATVALVAILLWSMDVRSRTVLITIPLVYATLTFLVFGMALSVRLPAGLLPFINRALGIPV